MRARWCHGCVPLVLPSDSPAPQAPLDTQPPATLRRRLPRRGHERRSQAAARKAGPHGASSTARAASSRAAPCRAPRDVRDDVRHTRRRRRRARCGLARRCLRVPTPVPRPFCGRHRSGVCVPFGGPAGVRLLQPGRAPRDAREDAHGGAAAARDVGSRGVVSAACPAVRVQLSLAGSLWRHPRSLVGRGNGTYLNGQRRQGYGRAAAGSARSAAARVRTGLR